MPYTTRSGVKLYYEVVGDCSKATPIVLHAGFSNCVDDWYRLGYVDKLAPHFPLVMYDYRGHGQSEKPHDPKLYTTSHFAEDCLAVLDEVGIEQCHFFGSSMGGNMGLLMSTVAPERYCSYTIGCCYPSGGTFLNPLKPLIEEGIIKGNEYYVRCIEEDFINCHFPDTIRANYAANDLQALLAGCQIDWPNAIESFSQLNTPHLLYVSEKEAWRPDMETLASACHSPLHILKGLTHAEGYWNSDVVTPLIRQFLENIAY